MRVFPPLLSKAWLYVFKESSQRTKIKDILEPKMRLDPGSEPGSVFILTAALRLERVLCVGNGS